MLRETLLLFLWDCFVSSGINQQVSFAMDSQSNQCFRHCWNVIIFKNTWKRLKYLLLFLVLFYVRTTWGDKSGLTTGTYVDDSVYKSVLSLSTKVITLFYTVVSRAIALQQTIINFIYIFFNFILRWNGSRPELFSEYVMFLFFFFGSAVQ